MLPIKNILYPVDFSSRCREVWPAVIQMAKKLDVPVTLLHVLHGVEDQEQIAPALDGARKRAEHELIAFSTGPRQPTLHIQIEIGAAAECIVQAAEKLDSPLIMMPTRGYTGFRQLLLGSVTAGVLHDAECPVWTEAHTEGAPAPPREYRSIVCAVDMDSHTPAVLRAASEIQSRFGAELHVVHSVPGIDSRFPSAVATRAHSLLVANAKEDFPGHCAQAGISAALEIVEDPDLVGGIVKAVAGYNADLLIIGRGVLQGPLGRLRTNAHDFIRRSPCPVLSV